MEFLGIWFVDWVGYFAMVMVLISFLMKEIKTLRMINAIGCALFILYGVLLAISWPIIITNTAILGINLYYVLVKKK